MSVVDGVGGRPARDRACSAEARDASGPDCEIIPPSRRAGRPAAQPPTSRTPSVRLPDWLRSAAPGWPSTASRSPKSPRPSARPVTSTAPARFASAYARARRGVRRLPARHPLRAQGQLDAGHRPAAARAWAARPTPTRWARSTWRCACGFTPGEIVFTGVGKSADELERAVTLGLKAINVESPGRARPHRSARRGRTAPPRAWPCASTPTSTPRATRTSRPGLRSNKFGVPIGEAPALFREMAARAGLDARRRARPHRIADHHARAAARAAEAVVRPGRGAARRGHRARAPRPRRRPRHLLRRRPRDRLRPSTPRARGRPRGPAASRWPSSPGACSSGPAGVLLARVVDVKRRPRRQALRRARRRHDRADAAGALQRLSPHRAGEPAPRRGGAVRRRRARLREQRHVRARPRAAAARGGRPGRDSRRRRVRRGDGPHVPAPSRCRPKCWSTAARGASCAAARPSTRCWRSEIADDLPGHADCLRRARPERQADAGRAPASRRFEAAGHAVELLSFPDYTHRHRRRDRPGAAGASATTRPTRMQLLYVANRYECRPRIERWLAAGDRRDLRPLPGVEHRLRRGAWGSTRLAGRHPALPAAAGADGPARHRPGDGAHAQAGRPRQVRARPRAAGPRARQLPAPGAHTPGWVRLDGERDKDAVAADVLSAVRSRLGLL